MLDGEPEPFSEANALLNREALRGCLVRDAAQVRRLVREHRDRKRRVVTGTEAVLERDPVQRTADARLEVGKRRGG